MGVQVGSTPATLNPKLQNPKPEGRHPQPRGTSEHEAEQTQADVHQKSMGDVKVEGKAREEPLH